MPFGVEITNYQVVQTKLRSADPVLKKAFNAEIRTLVKTVVSTARTHAAGVSSKIPPAIGSSVSSRFAGVRVSRKVPLATLEEFGDWRHPLFGNRDYWYAQKAKPSVKPAVDASRGAMKIAADRAAVAMLRETGL